MFDMSIGIENNVTGGGSSSQDGYERKSQPLEVEIRPLASDEIEQVIPLLMANLKDQFTGEPITDEIEEVIGFISGQKDGHGRAREFLAAHDVGGKIVGISAYSTLEPNMLQHFFNIIPDEAVEILNGFTDPATQRGGGVGKALFDAVVETAKAQGKKYLVANSGPRYSANWGFHDRMFDKRTGFLKNQYGPGRDAMTWIKYLS